MIDREHGRNGAGCGGVDATQMHKLLGLLLFLGNMGNVFVL